MLIQLARRPQVVTQRECIFAPNWKDLQLLVETRLCLRVGWFKRGKGCREYPPYDFVFKRNIGAAKIHSRDCAKTSSKDKFDLS